MLGLPRDSDQLGDAWLEELFPVGVDCLALLGPDHVGKHPLFDHAGWVRECRCVQQSEQPVKGVALALVRCCGKHQKIWSGFGQTLAQLMARHLRSAPAQPVGFIDNDQIPPRADEVEKPVLVVLRELLLTPALARIHGFD